MMADSARFSKFRRKAKVLSRIATPTPSTDRMFHVKIDPSTHRKLKIESAKREVPTGVLIDEAVELMFSADRAKVGVA